MQLYSVLLIRLLQFVDGETEITSEELQELRLDMQVVFVFTTYKEPVQRHTNCQFRSVNLEHCSLDIKSFSSDASLCAL